MEDGSHRWKMDSRAQIDFLATLSYDPEVAPFLVTSKFGYVSSINQASPYAKYCYENSPYWGKPVLFLRNSNWMVLMENDRAKELIRVSGC